MKRKLQVEEQEQSLKMMKLNTSCVIPEKRDVSDAITDKSGTKNTFNMTEKTAKSNLLKSAKRNYLEVEAKQKSTNLKFSAGAYLFNAIPFVKFCE